MMQFGKRRSGSVVEMLDEIAPGLSEEVQTKLDATMLSNMLAVLRNKSELTQAQLAAKMNCTQSTVSKLESSDDADLCIGEIRQVARALGADLEIEFRFKVDASKIAVTI